jgi:4-aminobutyrate aminotransferase-like enzyme
MPAARAVSPRNLRRGDLLPRIVTPPPGPSSRAYCVDLARLEAPAVNTLYRGQPSLLWQAARGSNVLDVDGNRFLDFTSGFGVALVGHRHPRVVAALRRQSAVLIHGLGDVHAHPARVALAAALVARAPMPDARVHFAISGAEAVEVALATAILATGRRAVVAFTGAYHGLTFGALAVTSRPAFRRPFLSALNPHARQLAYGCPPAALADALAPGDVACVVLEPILGREGVVAPPQGWLALVAEVCRRHRVPLAVDEVLTGGGRTGRFWAISEAGVEPDLLCCGKALGGGLPFAAVLGRRELMAAWRTDGEALRTATFLAHPLACATALAALAVIDDEGLVERAGALEALFARRLGEWRRRHPAALTDVRGRGAWWGLELASAGLAARFTAAALARGVLLLAGGPDGRVAQLAPPLTITPRQLDRGLDLLADSLAEAAAGVGSPA